MSPFTCNLENYVVLLSANSLIAVSRKSLTLILCLVIVLLTIHASKYNCVRPFALPPLIVSNGFRAFCECASCPAHFLNKIHFQLVDGSCLSGLSPQLKILT